MRVLALDTTTRAGSVALVLDGDVVDERGGDPSRTLGERLPGEMLDLLGLHGLRPGDIDVFAVAAGPGSFTGLRIGIATVQGFAFTTGRPVVAVSALDVLAHLASRALPMGAWVAAAVDAHRHEVFASLYRVADAPPFGPDRVVESEGPLVAEPGGLLERWTDRCQPSPIWWTGDGAVAHADLIDARAGHQRCPDATPWLAGGIGRIASLRVRAGEAGTAGAIQPLYVRRPDAVLARERTGLTAS